MRELASEERAGGEPAIMLFEAVGGGSGDGLELDGELTRARVQPAFRLRDCSAADVEARQMPAALAAGAQQRGGEQAAKPRVVLERRDCLPRLGCDRGR